MSKSFFNVAFLALSLSLCVQKLEAQGFSEQLKAAQTEPPAAAEPALSEPVTAESTPAEPVAEEKKAEPTPSKKTGYPSYEVYLDTIELIAKQLLPARITLDSMKYVINSQFGTEKTKQLKIENLERQHKIKEKKIMDKLTSTIRLSQDIQPEWNGMLQQDAKEEDEYKKRIDKFKEKISDMNTISKRINDLLVKLKVDQSDIDALEKKNMLYVKRMERACELMRDYMLKEGAQVLSTEKKKFDMSLGEYDLDKNELPVKVKNITSNIPFDYQGAIKIKQRMAETIDGEIEGFTASVDYLNFPFIVDGEKVYPAAKKMHLYYEDNEVNTVGIFKNVEGFDWREGYAEWAAQADSLISGKLKYRALDSSYAMKKVRVGPPFWTPKRIFRATTLVLSAASLGLGYWQHSSVKNKTKSANELYSETLKAAINEDRKAYDPNAYEDKVKSMQNSTYAKNGFFISAGVFGVAGVLSFFF